MSIWLWLAVAGIGGFGAVARFVLDAAVTGRCRRDFPFGTLVVNLGGALVLGLLVGLQAGSELLLLGGTAMLGSFTTFSTWMLETHRLAEDGQLRLALANAGVSIALGFGAALLGHVIGHHL